MPNHRKKVAEAARFNRIERILHMSALGATADAPSEYLRSKAAGEESAHAQAAAGNAGHQLPAKCHFRPA